MTGDISGEDVLMIAKDVAKRYARRVFWARGHMDDMTSEAVVAILQARSTYDEQVGVAFGKYAARAAYLRVADYLWGESSPASGGGHDPKKNIAGRFRAPLARPTCHYKLDDDNRTPWPELCKDAREVVDELHAMDRQVRIRDRVRSLARRTKNGDLAEHVLLHGEASGDLSRRSGKNVHRAVELVRRKARQDAGLYELWRSTD